MKQPNGERVYIQEVCTRDGFQAESRFVPTEDKVRLIDELGRTGLAAVEVSSFSSPRAIPSLADAEEVFRRITRSSGVDYIALVPNVRGCRRALACGVDFLNVVMSASESHNRANLRMSCEDSLLHISDIVAESRGRARVSASLSTAFGCPFDGKVPADRVFTLVERLAALGIERITLSDTTGVANPAQVLRLLQSALSRWPEITFTAHFHDTRAMGMPNVLAALEAGVVRFDASLGGLGGCPFAPGATGNICTEDLVHMLETMGYVTGVDLDRILEVASRLPSIVQHEIEGRVVKAGPSSRRYSMCDIQPSFGTTAGPVDVVSH